MSDIQLTASLDFRAAEQQVDQFVTSTKRKLSEIVAAAKLSGGSNHRPREGSSGGRSAVDAAKQELAAQRALEAARNRILGLELRIQRQLQGNAELSSRATRALDTYSRALATHGTRTMEGVRAYGLFQREATRINSEIARMGGLLPTLNRGFAQNRTAIGGVITSLGTLTASMRGAGGAAAVSLASFSAFALQASNGARSAAGMGAALAALTSTVALTVAAVAAVGAAVWVAASAMTNASDRVALLTGRFTALTGSAVTGRAAFAQLVAISNTLGVSLEDASQGFARFVIAGRDIGLTTKEAGTLAETVLKLGRIGGATTAEMTSGMIQLGQALASNRLGGDEFRSVMENLPLVARLIAKEMGVGVGALKNLASQGKLTADVITRALSGAVNDVNRQFEEMPRLASAMAVEIGNEWTLLLSDLDKVLAGSSLVKNVYGMVSATIRAARNLIAPSDEKRAADLQTTIATRQQNIADRADAWFQSPWADAADRRAIVEAERELQEIRTRQAARAQAEREEAEHAARARELHQIETHRQAVEKIMEKADPMTKATKERDTALSALKAALDAGAIEETRYAEAVAVVNREFELDVSRIENRKASLSEMEKAVNGVSEAYKLLQEEVANSQATTERMQSQADADLLDTKAYERTADFLSKFAKDAGIAGASLDELAAKAGITLDTLVSAYRKLEKEELKRAALDKIEGIKAETDQNKRLAEAYLKGAEAIRTTSREIAIENEIRRLGLNIKDADLNKLREEVRVRMEGADAAARFNDAAQFSRQLTEEHATPTEKLAKRLAELKRNYDLLAASGKRIPAEIETAFARARGAAEIEFTVIGKAFKSLAEDICEFPDDASPGIITTFFEEALN